MVLALRRSRVATAKQTHTQTHFNSDIQEGICDASDSSTSLPLTYLHQFVAFVLNGVEAGRNPGGRLTMNRTKLGAMGLQGESLHWLCTLREERNTSET